VGVWQPPTGRGGGAIAASRHQLATWVGAAGRLAVNWVGGILPFARTRDANWDLLKSVVRILSSGRAPK